eukprot:GHVS01059853.1.p1 GENE.GHVS01059853.1~~GHVS01059853.1.p1  ORF type:complete len:857 (+),score=134.96 GHVS01059853.1:102-2672(+)
MDDRVFYSANVLPPEVVSADYEEDDLLRGVGTVEMPELPVSNSSASLSNLPSVKEARESFLYFMCRHAPCHLLAQTPTPGAARVQAGIGAGSSSSGTAGNVSGFRSGHMLYRSVLMANIRAKKHLLQIDLTDIVDANSSHRRAYEEMKNGNMQATPFRSGEGQPDGEDQNRTQQINQLQIHMKQGALGRLFVALRRRPLWYLTELEKVCRDVVVEELKRVGKSGMPDDDDVRDIPRLQLMIRGRHTKLLQLRELTVSLQEQFVVIPGIIIQASFPHPRARDLAIQCRYCDHRIMVPVPSTKDKIVLPRSCLYAMSKKTGGSGRGGVEVLGGDGLFDQGESIGCANAKDPYVIIQTETEWTDTQTLKLQEYPEAVPVGDVPRSVVLNAFGYCCGELRPGERVNIHGVLSNYNPLGDKYDAETVPYIQVLAYDKLASDHSQDLHFSVQEAIEFQSMVRSGNIHDRIFRSVAPALFGLEDVKKAVACVLFGGVQKKASDESRLRGDINMLMLGDPSVAKSQVLKFANRASAVAVYTSGKGSSAAGLTASVIRDRHGVFALEGGAMVLADGGVVCIDEFDKMRDEDIVAMHEAMEQQTISINKAGISTMLNSRCSVIAAANPTFGSYDDTQDTTDQHEMKATILSRFDVIFMLRDREDVQKDTALCKHILMLQEGSTAAEGVAEGDIPLALFRRFISYAKHTCKPRLSPGALDKLRTFYVNTRAGAREDKRSSTRKIPITLRQLESLYRLTESFAKMELSKDAAENHVDMAIDLFTASTVETSKHTLVFESMTPQDQRAVQLAEEAILGLIPPGGRASRLAVFKNLQQKGFERTALARALATLIKMGKLQERADRSVRRL